MSNDVALAIMAAVLKAADQIVVAVYRVHDESGAGGAELYTDAEIISQARALLAALTDHPGGTDT